MCRATWRTRGLADRCSPIESDGGGNVDCYNRELELTPDEDKKWYTMDWLFAECYLYVQFEAILAGEMLIPSQVPAAAQLLRIDEALEALRPLLR